MQNIIFQVKNTIKLKTIEILLIIIRLITIYLYILTVISYEIVSIIKM